MVIIILITTCQFLTHSKDGLIYASDITKFCFNREDPTEHPVLTICSILSALYPSTQLTDIQLIYIDLSLSLFLTLSPIYIRKSSVFWMTVLDPAG